MAKFDCEPDIRGRFVSSLYRTVPRVRGAVFCISRASIPLVTQQNVNVVCTVCNVPHQTRVISALPYFRNTSGILGGEYLLKLHAIFLENRAF